MKASLPDAELVAQLPLQRVAVWLPPGANIVAWQATRWQLVMHDRQVPAPAPCVETDTPFTYSLYSM